MSACKPAPIKIEVPLEASYESLSHAELVDACSQSPQHPAWEEFHRRYNDGIKTFLVKQWRLWNEGRLSCPRDLLQDLVQEVYIKLIENNQQALKKFKGINENSFLAYLARIAINVVAEYFRRGQANKRRGRTVSLDMLADEKSGAEFLNRSITLDYLSCNFECEYMNVITLKELSELLDEKPTGPNHSRDKMIFKLHVFEGFSAQQIEEAEGLNLKASTIESIIRRMRNRLQRSMRAKLSPLRRKIRRLKQSQ